MLRVQEVMARYKVDEKQAKAMLVNVERMFNMDWSEMSWGQIDKCMNAAKKEGGSK